MRPLLIAVLLAVSTSAFAADERSSVIETFARLTPSVGALYALEEGGDMKFLCSATAVGRSAGKTIILTAHHCVRKGVSYLINFGDRQFKALTVWKIPHYEVDKQRFPRRFNEPATDAALFLMDGEDVPIVPMAKNSSVEPGKKVAMVGYPLGVSKIRYEGTVAGVFDRQGGDAYGYLLLQIFGAPGSSGSSVVDIETGQVIGILVSGKQAYSGLPVIFATPIEYLSNLLPVHPENPEDPR